MEGEKKRVIEQIWFENKYEQKDNLNIDIYQMDENLFMMKLTTKMHVDKMRSHQWTSYAE